MKGFRDIGPRWPGNISVIFAAWMMLLALGCQNQNRDELALVPYRNIPTGTIILLCTKSPGKDPATGREIEILQTNECMFLSIEEGAVMVTNKGTLLGIPGSMVQSIQIKPPSPAQPTASAKP